MDQEQKPQVAKAEYEAPPALLRFYRTPFIGLFAFIAVLLSNPVAHSLSVTVRHLMPPAYGGVAQLLIGLVGFALLLRGTRREGEIQGTLLGFAAGLLVWLGWASFLFSFNPMDLNMPPVEVTPGASRPANLLFIQGSFGICIATLLFFVFNKDTKCDAFRWLQRKCRLSLGKAGSGQGRNYCRITFMETIYVTWFCYGFSLFLGDGRFLGYNHWGTYAIVGALAVWSIYLIWKLSKFSRVMAAIRFAIPTKAIFWIPFGEFGPKYGFYEDVWINPQKYSLEMWGVFVLFMALICATAFFPQRKQKSK